MTVKDLLSLKGKVVLLTGGTGRYGKGILEGLLEADGTVITASRNLKANEAVVSEYQKQGYDAHAMLIDQGNHESVLEIRQKIEAEFGRLDVLVNNAIAWVAKGYESPLEQFAESMRINATGMYDITREMADLIAQSGGGSVVNIASMFGMFGPDLSNYEGTDTQALGGDYFFHKGGMISLTRYLARVLADKNIRVNSISPGGILSPDVQPEVFLKIYTRKVPVGRMANTDDIKGVVVLLASEASAYINGENILMDGGMHA